MKVQWEPSCTMWLDRQTDMMKLMDAFRSFANTLRVKFFPNNRP